MHRKDQTTRHFLGTVYCRLELENRMAIISLTETAERAMCMPARRAGFPPIFAKALGLRPRERPPRGRKDMTRRPGLAHLHGEALGLPTSPTREISRGWDCHVSVNGIPNRIVTNQRRPRSRNIVVASRPLFSRRVRMTSEEMNEAKRRRSRRARKSPRSG